MSRYVSARPPITLSPGEMVRVARELQEMTQAELAAASGIPQPTLSAIETGRQKLGVERAERLAIALKSHPAVLLWPNWADDHPVTPAPRTKRTRARAATPPAQR